MTALPRCPFAGASGLEIHGCPGYEPATVAAGDIAGMGGAYETCCHLSAEAGERGFYPACHHPEAASVVPSARLFLDEASLRAGAAG